jgi:hypothetical protein
MGASSAHGIFGTDLDLADLVERNIVGSSSGGCACGEGSDDGAVSGC